MPKHMKAKHSKQLFEDIFARDRGRCVYCGVKTLRLRRGLHRSPDRATLDHVIPKSQGGRLIRENLVLACQACNNERGTLEAGEFRRLKRAAPDREP